MARPVKAKIREYRGETIYRRGQDERPGLPWYTIAPNLRADTLAGIKELIREYQQERA